jgi:enolase
MIIKKVKAKLIRNSRGEETIKIQVKTDKGKGEASAPSGASKGEHEAKAFIKPVNECVKFINKSEFKDIEINSFDDLKKIEEIINRDNLGSNPTIALEYAILKCFGPLWKVINSESKELPRPLGNVIGGGVHIKGGEHSEFQEFLLYPLNAPTFDEAVKANELAHRLIKKYINSKDLEMTDEGAWAPEMMIEDILDLLQKIVKQVYSEMGITLKIGLDVAASSFWDGKNYIYRDKKFNSKEQIDYISLLIEKYNLHYVEDPLHENDFSGFAKLTEKYKDKCMICGDDLTVTNLTRLKKAIKSKSINAMIVKPNQNGSLLDTAEVIKEAKKHKLYLIVSHRSGETLDASISHLAVGYKLPIIKCGVYGKERKIKLSEISKIEKQIKYKI